MALPTQASLTFNYKRFAFYAATGVVLTIVAFLYQWPYTHSYHEYVAIPPHDRPFILAIPMLAYTLTVCCSAFIFIINPYKITVGENGLNIEGFENVPWSRVVAVNFIDNRDTSNGFSTLLIDIATLNDPKYQKIRHVRGTWRTSLTDDGFNLRMSFPKFSFFMDGSGVTIANLATHYINVNLAAKYK